MRGSRSLAISVGFDVHFFWLVLGLLASWVGGRVTRVGISRCGRYIASGSRQLRGKL